MGHNIKQALLSNKRPLHITFSNSSRIVGIQEEYDDLHAIDEDDLEDDEIIDIYKRTCRYITAKWMNETMVRLITNHCFNERKTFYPK